MAAYGWVVLARLVRPQGRKGELLADLLTDFPERFADRRDVFLQRGPLPSPATEPRPLAVQPAHIESHWLHKGRVVLKFDGVDSINDAEALRGMDVVIPREFRMTLTDDEVYIDDLLDCVVYDCGDRADRADCDAHSESPCKVTKIGRIIDVDTESTAGALLVVERATGDEVLIPFVKAYLRRVDVAARRIEMKLPKGLLEINAPPARGERRKDPDV